MAAGRRRNPLCRQKRPVKDRAAVANVRHDLKFLTQLSSRSMAESFTVRPHMARTWDGEVGPCCCLPLLPQLACNILATTFEPFAGAQYEACMILNRIGVQKGVYRFILV